MGRPKGEKGPRQLFLRTKLVPERPKNLTFIPMCKATAELKPKTRILRRMPGTNMTLVVAENRRPFDAFSPRRRPSPAPQPPPPHVGIKRRIFSSFGKKFLVSENGCGSFCVVRAPAEPLHIGMKTKILSRRKKTLSALRAARPKARREARAGARRAPAWVDRRAPGRAARRAQRALEGHFARLKLVPERPKKPHFHPNVPWSDRPKAGWCFLATTPEFSFSAQRAAGREPSAAARFSPGPPPFASHVGTKATIL